MRPGRNAPDNKWLYQVRSWNVVGFNEAGAKCPG